MMVDADRVAIVLTQLMSELDEEVSRGNPGTRLDGATAAMERLRAEGLVLPESEG
jgi:hypothetical protein